ncbi:hypothetical protein SprV_0501740800 [Sparganum proliferum]
MNFGSFLRNLSSDRETASEEGRKSSDGFTGGSLFGAPSRFLGSVTAKTGNLVSDFSQKVDLANKLDTIKRHTSIDKIGQSVLGSAFTYSTPKAQESSPTQHADETWVMPPKSAASPEGTLHESVVQNVSLNENPTVPISEVEQPRKTQMMTHEESTERHQNPFNVESKRVVEQSSISTFSGTPSAIGNPPLTTPDVSESTFSASSNRMAVQPSGSVDYSSTSTRSSAPVKRQSTTPGFGGKPPPRPPPPRSGSQSIDDPFQKQALDTAVKEHTSQAVPPETPPSATRQSEAFSPTDLDYLTRLQCQEIVSAVDTMIADDMEYGLQAANRTAISEQPRPTNGYHFNSRDYSENMSSFENPEQKSHFEPQQQQHEHDDMVEAQEVNVSSSPFQEVSDASSASEYGVGGSEAVYGTEDVNEYRRSEHWPESFATAEVHPEQPAYFAELIRESTPEDTSKKELETFIGDYVEGLVNGSEAALESKNEAFKEHMFTPTGREAFAKAMEVQGTKTGGLLQESGLRMILSRVVFVLNECQKAEDFVPAKRILTTSLVFCIEDPIRTGERVFLFSYIKNQPIWHSLRFWNACFFQSVQESRAKLMDQGKSNAEIDMAITAQIRSYLNTMQVFSLHATMRLEFLRKQGALFNLCQDDIEALSTAIENETTSG